MLWFALLGTCLLCNHLLRTPREQHGPYLFAGTCTNTSFPGIPIAFAILGQRSAVGASIFDMVTTVFNFTIGFAILSASGKDGQKKSPLDILKAPVVYACFIAIAMFFTGWQLPAEAQSVLASIGEITSPPAMLVVGALVAQAELRDNWTIGDVFVLHHFCPQSLRSTPRHFETHPHRCSSAPRCSRRTTSAT